MLFALNYHGLFVAGLGCQHLLSVQEFKLVEMNVYSISDSFFIPCLIDGTYGVS